MDEKNNKITVTDYLSNKELLELTYTPFDNKLMVVGHIIKNVVDAIGGINTSFLRRIATEVFIETATNIDMNAEDENGLKGFDQLIYHNELDNLISLIGNEYKEFATILDERLNDYIRTETNPAITIASIYEQIQTYFNTVLSYLSERIQNIDVEELSKQLRPLIDKVGEVNEG